LPAIRCRCLGCQKSIKTSFLFSRFRRAPPSTCPAGTARAGTLQDWGGGGGGEVVVVAKKCCHLWAQCLVCGNLTPGPVRVHGSTLGSPEPWLHYNIYWPRSKLRTLLRSSRDFAHGQQAGYSSVGRASDCALPRQSDGPWLDSGWPDFSSKLAALGRNSHNML
jgi:hypothetical protein